MLCYFPLGLQFSFSISGMEGGAMVVCLLISASLVGFCGEAGSEDALADFDVRISGVNLEALCWNLKATESKGKKISLTLAALGSHL